ncbi:MAG: hypothetical protein DRI92_02030 [Aquificota bacterium]|nr:MAG: hypothetical protein DRI92_02030 [Aquificota bacterium]
MDVAQILIYPLKCIFKDPGYLIPPLLPAIVGIIYTAKGPSTKEMITISLIAQMVLGLFSSTVLTDMALRGYQGKPSSLLTSLSKALSRFPTALAASFLIATAAMAGLILLIIPGILVLVFTFFTLQEVVLENKGITEAIKESIALVKTNFLFTLSLFLYLTSLTMLLEALSASVSHFASFVTAMVISPYVTLAITFCYLEMKNGTVITPPPP